MARKATTFEGLAWQDLEEWAGSAVVSRGKGYSQLVHDLAMAEDGCLVAWVDGTHRYATAVGFDASGNLESTCTCPYAIACKHAVATILVYLKAVEEGTEVPRAAGDDERLVRLSEKEEGALAVPEPGQQVDDVTRYIDKLDVRAARALLKEMAENHEEVHADLSDRAEIQEISPDRLSRVIRREIDDVSSEPAYRHHWSGDGHIPDYSRVRERLKLLLKAGRADEVVQLGTHLLERGIRQVEMSHDEGETSSEITSCMSVTYDALARCSMTPAQRILWDIDARLKDEYCILDGIKGPLINRSGTRAGWRAVADELDGRLGAMPPREGGGEHAASTFTRDYRRGRIRSYLLTALRNAGRADEIIPLLEREAPVGNCYVELVDALLDAGRAADAERWAREGYAHADTEFSGMAAKLLERLLSLAERRKDRALVAAYRAMQFFEHANVTTYDALKKSAEQAGHWPVVRGNVLTFLESGVRPDQTNGTKAKRRTAPSWPLPPTGLDVKKPRYDHQRFPDAHTLMDIAIAEQRYDDAIAWHGHLSRSDSAWGDTDERLAAAVALTHPDVAIALWKKTAERLIEHSDYDTACTRLRRVEETLKCVKRTDEWEQYKDGLLERYKRRRKFLQTFQGIKQQRRPILQRGSR